MGTALYILGGTQDWITHPNRPNFDVTAEMATAIGALPRKAPWPVTAYPRATTDGFDFPVARPDAAPVNPRGGYYVAAGLAEEGYFDLTGFWHTGEDWNDLRGGDSDLGAPVYAVANGRVETSRFYTGSWGSIVLIEHLLPDGRQVWSQYAHLKERLVTKGDVVRRGQQIGTIGKGGADQYSAHLHFEIRTHR
ncbi:MAG: M23 family metallopeptidase, partial [Chloroflexota bacterium]